MHIFMYCSNYHFWQSQIHNKVYSSYKDILQDLLLSILICYCSLIILLTIYTCKFYTFLDFMPWNSINDPHHLTSGCLYYVLSPAIRIEAKGGILTTWLVVPGTSSTTLLCIIVSFKMFVYCTCALFGDVFSDPGLWCFRDCRTSA